MPRWRGRARMQAQQGDTKDSLTGNRSEPLDVVPLFLLFSSPVGSTRSPHSCTVSLLQSPRWGDIWPLGAGTGSEELEEGSSPGAEDSVPGAGAEDG